MVARIPTLAAETLIKAFLPAADESLARPVRTTRLEVIQNPIKSKPGNLSFGAPGSIVVFIARKGTKVLDEVRKAIAEGGERVEELEDRWKGQMARRKQVPVEKAVQMMVREPVFAELRYGGATLADCLWVPGGLDCVFLLFPYNGGGLAREGFTLVEHYKEGAGQVLEGLVLKTTPPLTVAEKAALRQVPADQRVQNVGMHIEDCETTGVAVAVVAVAFVAAAALAVAVAVTVRVAADEKHIPEEDLRRLGPAASARKLLELRREILKKYAKHAKGSHSG